MAKKKTTKKIGASHRKHKMNKNSLANLKEPWKPNESGNPEGAKVEQMNLWRYTKEYMNMTVNELREIAKNKDELMAAKAAALRDVMEILSGDRNRYERAMDRSEGKVADVQYTNPMSEAMAEAIREKLYGDRFEDEIDVNIK